MCKNIFRVSRIQCDKIIHVVAQCIINTFYYALINVPIENKVTFGKFAPYLHDGIGEQGARLNLYLFTQQFFNNESWKRNALIIITM